MSQITADFIGRDLHITVGDLPPYIVHPLPGQAGLQMTETYIETATQRATPEQMTDALAMALDGATRDPETRLWSPHPFGSRPNSERMDVELSMGETEDVAMLALFWQTILNQDGVAIYLSAGGGVDGHTKALRALTLRLGLSPSTTSPNTALESLIQSQDSTPSTSSLQVGVKPGRRPLDRLPKLLGGKRKRQAR